MGSTWSKGWAPLCGWCAPTCMRRTGYPQWSRSSLSALTFFHPDDPRRQESWFWLTRCLPNWLSHSALVCNSLHCSSNTSTINLAAWAFLITDTTCFVVPAVKGVLAPLARSDHCCGSLSPLRVAAFCSCSTSQGCLLFLFANTIHSHGLSKVIILSRTYCKTWGALACSCVASSSCVASRPLVENLLRLLTRYLVLLLPCLVLWICFL